MSPPIDRKLIPAVLIPALNEEEALPAVLEGLRATRADRVVVVDNGSTDGTAEVARRGGAEVVSEPKRGYGAACLAGIARLAEGTPPDVVVFMDGDQSDDPAALEILLAPIDSGRAEFVIGIRTSEGRQSAVPVHARLGNSLVAGGAALLHGLRFRDLGPFRAIRFDVLQALAMDDENWGWTLQMQLRAHRMGVSTVEVPVPHRPRAGGRSKVSGSVIGSVRAGAKMLLTLVTERLRPAPGRWRRGTGGGERGTGRVPPREAGGPPPST